MGKTLRDSAIEVTPGGSAIVPVEIDGLPAEIEALGRRWRRKVEFHMTVLAGSVIEETRGSWDALAGLLGGRSLSPIRPTRELRLVGRHPQKPGLKTIVVMVECPALVEVYRELSAELGADLTPPPAHVTVYSTDPDDGIGISNEEQLRERAPELGEAEQEEVRRSMRFEEVFGPWSQQ